MIIMEKRVQNGRGKFIILEQIPSPTCSWGCKGDVGWNSESNCEWKSKNYGF